MDIIDRYGNIIKAQIEKRPGVARKMIDTGMAYESFRTAHLADKNLPLSLRALNHYAIEDVRQGFLHPEDSVWVNLFAPVEILHCYKKHVLSVECISSYLSGFRIEDYLLDYCETEGISTSLCSYHKNMIGAMDSGLIRPARCGVTTTTVCDANLQTFRHLSRTQNVPITILDVPMVHTEESVSYLERQLEAYVRTTEEMFQQDLDMVELGEMLERENRTKQAMESILPLLRDREFKSTLTLQMFMLFASHLHIGKRETLRFYRQMLDELEHAGTYHGMNILWVHLVPYFQPDLKAALNMSEKCRVQIIELNYDYRGRLDPEKPLHSLAEKMIDNVYVGPYQRKIDLVKDLAARTQPDGIVNFCHWGCKQSSGGAMLLKRELQKEGWPVLVLDGDGLDRRNTANGQIATRWESFEELLEKRRENAGSTEERAAE